MLFADMHLLAAGARLLGQREVDQPFFERRHADDEGPVDLARGSAGESLGEMARRPRRSRDQQGARRVLVEPVDELGPRAVIIGQPVEQAVEVVVGLGPALRCQPGRLGEDKGVRVGVDHHLAHQLGFLRGQRVHSPLWLKGPRGRSLGRRHADLLPRLDPVARRRALPVEPQLPRPRPSRHDVEAGLGHMALEPTIEADAIVILLDGECPGLRVAHREGA